MEAYDMHSGQALTAIRKQYKVARKWWTAGTSIRLSDDQRTVEMEVVNFTGVHKAPWNPQSDDMSATDWFIVNN